MKLTVDFPSEWICTEYTSGDLTVEVIESDKNSHEKYIEIMRITHTKDHQPVTQSLYWNTFRHELSLGDRHA